MITILGPTASGKTRLAVALAGCVGGEIISADSRQVYRGMDIGTGKDLDDYMVNGFRIPYHLIDIVDPGYEYNIFEYQRDFMVAYHDIRARGKTPVFCGGSGMYLEAVLKGYRMAGAGDDDPFLLTLHGKDDAELREMLRSYKTPHNTTDFEDRPRLEKAILVAEKLRSSGICAEQADFQAVSSTIFGIRIPRAVQMQRIEERLKKRLGEGMIAETGALLASGITPERLMRYGLEYRFITRYITGRITRRELESDLNIAIRQFAKRQMTWFRRMERQGFSINWIDGLLPVNSQLELILKVVTSGH